MKSVSDKENVPTMTTNKERQRTILIATCTALMAVVASVSGLSVAQQELAVELGAAQSTVLWIINAYTVALAAMLLPIGTAFAAAGQSDDPPAIITAAQQAFVDGWRQSMWVGVAVTAVLFVFVLLRGPVQMPGKGEAVN